MTEKPLTPHGEFASLEVETDDSEDIGEGVDGLVNCVGGENVLGVGVGVAEEPG
jgi:hypothetical protein